MPVSEDPLELAGICSLLGTVCGSRATLALGSSVSLLIAGKLVDEVRVRTMVYDIYICVCSSVRRSVFALLSYTYIDH